VIGDLVAALAALVLVIHGLVRVALGLLQLGYLDELHLPTLTTPAHSPHPVPRRMIISQRHTTCIVCAEAFTAPLEVDEVAPAGQARPVLQPRARQ
jgi:hypothetical protein